MFYEVISLHACHNIGKVMLESNKDLSCPKPDQYADKFSPICIFDDILSNSWYP